MKNYIFNLSPCDFTQILIASTCWMGNSTPHPTGTHLAYFGWTPLRIEIWVKPHGDKLKIRVEKVVFSLFYFFTILTFYSTFLLFIKKMVIHPLWLKSWPWILLVLIKLFFVVQFCFEAHFLPQNFSNVWRLSNGFLGSLTLKSTGNECMPKGLHGREGVVPCIV